MPSRNIKILFVAVILLSVIAQYVLYCDPSIANSTTTVPRDYFADPILTVEYVMDRPWYFKNLTRMDVDIWVNYLLYPVFDKIKLPRNFWLNGCINPQNYGGRTRKCQIKVANRLFRGCMIFAGVKPIRAQLSSARLGSAQLGSALTLTHKRQRLIRMCKCPVSM